jgi:hypothetical protein
MTDLNPVDAMTTDFRALCTELSGLDGHCVVDCTEEWADAMCRLRAALAEPVAEGPPDEELLRVAATAIDPYESSGIALGEYEPETECAVEVYGSELIAYARAVLAKWGHPKPQPVPVSERLPEPNDCNDEGYCWWWRTDEADEWWEFLYLRDARDHNRRCGLARYTHWLPYHAIPNLPNPND